MVTNVDPLTISHMQCLNSHLIYKISEAAAEDVMVLTETV